MTLHLEQHPSCIRDTDCEAFAAALYGTLGNGNYDWPVSLLDLHDMIAYLADHRTARKRANHARRLGYECGRISRSDYEDDIFEINTSLPERQGRQMTESYQRRNTFSPLPDYRCPRHRINEYGVLLGRKLVAYTVVYMCGEIGLISQILGHGDHLDRDVMYLLVTEAFDDSLWTSGPMTVFYNRHDSGTDGLRFFKERLGFQPARVEWAL